jgi:hypothetical protein
MDMSFEFFTRGVMDISFNINHYDNTKYRYRFYSWFPPLVEDNPLAKCEYIKFFNSYNRSRFLMEHYINSIPSTEAQT